MLLSLVRSLICICLCPLPMLYCVDKTANNVFVLQLYLYALMGVNLRVSSPAPIYLVPCTTRVQPVRQYIGTLHSKC